jgi:hypothetical protein
MNPIPVTDNREKTVDREFHTALELIKRRTAPIARPTPVPIQ